MIGRPEVAGFFKRFLKSVIYTVIIVLGILVIDNLTAPKSYINGVLQSTPYSSQIVSFGIGIVFTVVFCTITILDKLKR